jgi:hypothetical protein
MMSIKNDSGGGGLSGPFADLLRLQTEFQSRLGEETIRYVRRLQGAMAPASPGTVVLTDKATEIAARADGAVATLRLELENLQRVHSVVTPQITPLVSDTGTTWFPSSEAAAAFRILPPGALETLEIGLDVPEKLPPGTYRGALVLLGFREGALPVRVVIPDPHGQDAPPPSRSRARATTVRRPRRRRKP